MAQSLYRLSIDQCEAIVASGVFTRRDRIHPINGLPVMTMTEYPPHAAVCDAVRLALQSLLPVGWYVRPDKPSRIPNHASEPEPDVIAAQGNCWDYEQRHPEPADVALVVELAGSSRYEARAMAGMNAAAGIACYWSVNLADRVVETYTDPGPAGYAAHQVLKSGDHAPAILDGTELGRIAAGTILQRRA